MAKKKKKRKVKAPSGLEIKRNGEKYTFSWSKGEAYKKDQVLQVCFVTTDSKTEAQSKDKAFEKAKKKGASYTGKGKDNPDWKTVKGITKSSHKYTVDKKNDFYPSKKPLDGVLMRVKGINGSNKETESESDWTFKSLNVKIPKDPVISVEWGGQEAEYTSKFVASSPDVQGNKDTIPVKRLVWQTRLTNSAAHDNANWGSYQYKDGDVLTKVFNEINVTGNKYVRGLRVKAEGAGGWSNWIYKFYSYANPADPTNLVLEKSVINRSDQTITITVSWNAPNSAAKPVNTDTVEYYIGVPDADFNPSQGSWVVGRTVKDISDTVVTTKKIVKKTVSKKKKRKKSGKSSTSGTVGTKVVQTKKVVTKYKQYATFIINGLLEDDQCIWLRIVANHDAYSNPGNSKSFKDLRSNLAAPEITDIDISSGLHTATFTVASKTTAGNSYLAVRYTNSKDELYNDKIIGVVKTEDTVDPFSIAIPECDNISDIVFKVFSFIPAGEIASRTEGENDVTVYTFDTRMNSSEVTDITPNFPTNLMATRIDDNGTVQVTWSNTWKQSTGTEVLWADHADALYSTDAPNSFTVQNAKQQKLNIAGLDLGTTWYFWARLFQMDNGNNIYGPYSDMVDIDLASDPSVPEVFTNPSSGMVTLEGRITLSWAYVNTDNSFQEDGYLYDVILSSDTSVNTEKIYCIYTEGSERVTVVTPEGTENPTSEGWYELFPIMSNGPIGSSQMYEIEPDILKWEPGSSHHIVVQLISTTGRATDYSNVVAIRVTEEIDLNMTLSGDGIVEQQNPVSYALNPSATISHISGDVYLRSIEETIPYNAGKLSVTCSVTLNGETVERIIDPNEPLADPVISAFYGGTFDYITGRVTSLYKSDGTLLETPETTYIDSALLSINEGDNTISLLTGHSGTAIVTDNPLDVIVLKKLPFDVNIVGAGASGVTTLAIKRYGDFVVNRPDESEQYGYDGEIVGYFTKPGESTITVSSDSIFNNSLDDGGTYVLEATVSDENGQMATNVSDDDPGQLLFVNWEHQAMKPEEDDVNILIEDGVAKISVFKPTGADDTDRVDIYRLSADKPIRICRNVPFYDSNNPKTTTYVDPYPTIGDRGGYRVVVVTANGDFMAPDEGTDAGEIPAWEDFEGSVNSHFQLINYDGKELPLRYNVDIDNSWNKSFTMTHYLGGSIQGDWLAGAEQTGSLKGVVIDDLNPEEYESFRDLGNFAGVCHVRSIDGGNYPANIAVNDSTTHNNPGHCHNITLNITRVDSTSLDGMTLEEWEKTQEE